jgi:hypothetical protein
VSDRLIEVVDEQHDGASGVGAADADADMVHAPGAAQEDGNRRPCGGSRQWTGQDSDTARQLESGTIKSPNGRSELDKRLARKSRR